jgi:hypothetical protein
MNWNITPSDERLRLWKSLRKDIASLNLEDQLREIAKFCAAMPIGHRSLDYYAPDDWPTPWEILFHGTFCTSSISLLMFHTLVMVGRDPVLHLVDDNGELFLLPVIDYQYILNYELGQVSSYSVLVSDFKVLETFTKDRIKSIT